MLKRSSLFAIGIATLAAPWWPVPGVAALIPNALVPNALIPNALVPNALIPNGMTNNGINGSMTNFMTLQGVRLALPDGTEATFR